MQCRVSRFQSEDSGKHPCGVCRKGVESNSILCVEWVHKRCTGSGIKRKLKSNVDFRSRLLKEGSVGTVYYLLIYLSKFCYLGDTLGAGGGS